MSATTEKQVLSSPETTQSLPSTLHASSYEDLTSVGSFEYQSSASSPRIAVANIDIMETRESSAAETATFASPSRKEKGKEHEHDISETNESSSATSSDYRVVAVEDVDDQDERLIEPFVETNEFANSSNVSASPDGQCAGIGDVQSHPVHAQNPISTEPQSRPWAPNQSQIQPDYESCVWRPVFDYGSPRIPYPRSVTAVPLIGTPHATHGGSYSPVSPTFINFGAHPSQNAARRTETLLTVPLKDPSSSTRPFQRYQKRYHNQRAEYGESASAHSEQETFDREIQQARTQAATKVQRAVDAQIESVRAWGDELITSTNSSTLR